MGEAKTLKGPTARMQNKAGNGWEHELGLQTTILQGHLHKRQPDENSNKEDMEDQGDENQG